MKTYQKPIVYTIKLTTNDVLKISDGDPSSIDINWNFTSFTE